SFDDRRIRSASSDRGRTLFSDVIGKLSIHKCQKFRPGKGILWSARRASIFAGPLSGHIEQNLRTLRWLNRTKNIQAKRHIRLAHEINAAKEQAIPFDREPDARRERARLLRPAGERLRYPTGRRVRGQTENAR